MKFPYSKNLTVTLDVISGFRREADEKCALLGCYASNTGNFLLIGCTETSVRNYHYLLPNSPEERSYL